MGCKKFKPVGDLKIELAFINKDDGACYGRDDQLVTGDSVIDLTLGSLFRMLSREHGKCVSKVYQDRKDSPPAEVGWVFNARKSYEDRPKKTYLAEVWVTFFRDAQCECCETTAGRWQVTLDEAREMFAKKEACAA